MLGRALFVLSYKNEGTMCHVMCLVSRHVTKYNPIPQKIEYTEHYPLNIDNIFNFGPIFMEFSPKCRVLCLELTI